MLNVSPATLIPRPDTERLVELALEHLPTVECDILDLGTGTGAIALALGCERPDSSVTGIDLQPAAVALAQDNAERLGIDNVHFVQGNWFEPLSECYFDVIVSNPPILTRTIRTYGKGTFATSQTALWWRNRTDWRIYSGLFSTHLTI